MANAPEQSVIVVGAGPTGLALACELAAAGVSCTVLERRTSPSAQSRAMGLYSRTMEVLDLRGHADALTAVGRPVGRMVPARGAVLDFTELDTRFPALHVIPQSRTEEVLQRHALDLGVIVQRGAEVFGLEQDGSGVVLQVRTESGEWEESADYVVGCDGAHSAVRELAGIAFRGRTYDIAPVLADVRLRKPPPDDVLVLSGGGGVMVSVPYGDGLYRIAVARRDRPWTREAVTLEELSELLTLSLGFDPGPYDAEWLARFKIHQRIADSYRTGRVLLAGDAAHLHSPLGGQGLNLGIQDAVNLGWKLAAAVQGWAPAGLLDSYETERRPQAQRILRATDRATALATSPSGAVTAARRVVLAGLLGRRTVRRVAGEAISGLRAGYGGRGGSGGAGLGSGRGASGLGGTGRRSSLLRAGLGGLGVGSGERASGLRAGLGSSGGRAGLGGSGVRAGLGGLGSLRAAVGGSGVRVGRRVGDLTVPRPGGAPVRLYELMRDGRFVLLDLTVDGRGAGVAEAWGSRVCPVLVAGPVGELGGVAGLLVRPDGYAAWVDGEGDPGGFEGRVREALLRWCGAEGPVARRGVEAGPGEGALAGRERESEAAEVEPEESAEVEQA
ncbi:FAD-dependent oxidoreductase [Streptomyces sp. NPDC047081]|uniref:FAD-dependent oxidoreductase n=1 Tax=Streptomyces sp. NPDC047081 TaxID=3154706 RepID=UPI0033FDD772